MKEGAGGSRHVPWARKGVLEVETHGWGSKRGVEGSRHVAGARRRVLVGLDVLLRSEERRVGKECLE